MSAADSQTTLWLVSSLFWIGVMLLPLGLVLVISPGKTKRLGDIMNRWISTQAFFDALNKPHYQETLYYRHHHLLGSAIVIIASISIYMLVFYAGMETTAGFVQKMAESEFESWLFVNLYYLLTGMMFISLLVGLVILIRPSILKKLEAWGNRWIATEDKLSSLDEMHELPSNILSEKPRLFGLFVLFGSAYIIYMTFGVVF